MQERNRPEEVVTYVAEPMELYEAEPIPFLGQDIDHTIWPLTGGHEGLECEECHQQGVYAGTAGECEDCHGIPESELYAEHFEGECVECHLVDSWEPSEWDHAGIIDCQSCHEEEGPAEHYARTNDNWWLLSMLSDRKAAPKAGSLLDQRHYDRCADCHISTEDWAGSSLTTLGSQSASRATSWRESWRVTMEASARFATAQRTGSRWHSSTPT